MFRKEESKAPLTALSPCLTLPEIPGSGQPRPLLEAHRIGLNLSYFFSFPFLFLFFFFKQNKSEVFDPITRVILHRGDTYLATWMSVHDTTIRRARSF